MAGGTGVGDFSRSVRSAAYGAHQKMIKRDMKQFVQLQTSERLKKLESELKTAFDLPEDPDAIHDLRVAIRRLNQSLRVFRAWFDARRVKKFRGHLKKVME